MFRYSIFFAGVVMAALLASWRQPYLSAIIIYELLAAGALFAGFFALAINEWKPPRGTTLWPFIVMGAVPAVAQMVFVRLCPGLFWVAPACLVLLALYCWRKGALFSVNQYPKIHLPKSLYQLPVYIFLPVMLWDFRQYFALTGLWLFALWLVRSV